MTGRTPARLLAPVALVTTALALLLILASGGGGDGSSPAGRESPGGAAATATPAAGGNTDSEGRPRRKTYTVKPGDTPSAIAERLDIPLPDLLDLNPEVDPQTLSPGQKLRVR